MNSETAVVDPTQECVETPKRGRKPRQPKLPTEAGTETDQAVPKTKTRIRATPEDVIAKLGTKIQALQENNKRLTDDNKTLRSAFTRMARIPKAPKPAAATA